MDTHASAQLLGDRSHQCDTTEVYTDASGTRAYVLLDGIGSTPAVRRWTRATARRLAHIAARHADAEAALRTIYTNIATQRGRKDPFTRHRMPAACAVVAVTAPGQPLTIAWCGDSRAYLLTASGTLDRLTDDHNLRRVLNGRGNRNIITSCLGSTDTDDEAKNRYGHPAIESVTRHADGCRLLLASDGAYEPHEDAGHTLSDYLIGEPAEAARDFVETAVARARAVPHPHADNATVLVADIRPTTDPGHDEGHRPAPGLVASSTSRAHARQDGRQSKRRSRHAEAQHHQQGESTP